MKSLWKSMKIYSTLGLHSKLQLAIFNFLIKLSSNQEIKMLVSSSNMASQKDHKYQPILPSQSLTPKKNCIHKSKKNLSKPSLNNQKSNYSWQTKKSKQILNRLLFTSKNRLSIRYLLKFMKNRQKGKLSARTKKAKQIFHKLLLKFTSKNPLFMRYLLKWSKR